MSTEPTKGLNDSSLVLSIRPSIKTLATLASFYESLGIRVSNRSQLVTMLLDDYMELLILNGKTTAVDDLSKAVKILISLFNEGISDHNRKQLLKGLSTEMFLEKKASSSVADSSEPLAPVSATVLNALEDAYSSL